MTIAGLGPGHTHRLTRRASIIAKAAAVLALAMTCAVVGLYWYVLWSDEYAKAQREETRRSICEVLEAFPSTALLDQVRKEQGCGPGRPLSDFPPEIQREFAPPPSPAPPAPPRWPGPVPQRPDVCHPRLNCN
jgi:hypothetical protein